MPFIILFWLQLIIGFIGIAVMLRDGEQGISGWHLMAFLSAIGLALSIVSTRLLSKTEPEGRIILYYFLISLVVVAPFFIASYQPIPPTSWPWLFYIGIAMYFCLSLYTRAYAYIKPSILAPISYFSVVFAGLLEWLIGDHIPDIWTLTGIALVVTGGLLVIKLAKQ